MTNNLLSNALRFLAIDAVQKANSGHPGMPMGMADVATVLFKNHLRFYSQDPNWLNRDRFVLSAGHGSMLLYGLLHLTGYKDFSLEEIKNFRQYGAKTAGHPEFGHGAGIETTTGPLGQGLAMAVGMAMAEQFAAAKFSTQIFNHKTYVIVGDGCLMEGISHEAICLAGHLKLSQLIVLWDNNEISIDGKTSITQSDNQLQRFAAAGWHTLECNGHDFDDIDKAITQAKNNTNAPTLISCKTTIGFGSPNKKGTEGVHGAPLGAEEIALTRKELNWQYAAFEIPEEIKNEWKKIGQQHEQAYREWQKQFQQSPQHKDIQDYFSGAIPTQATAAIEAFKEKIIVEKPNIASRKASQEVLHILTDTIPNLIGGSADLTHSNLTKGKNQKGIQANNFNGTYVHYGVREFAMAAAMNGLALYGGFIPYGGTFLVFTDYCRPAIRLSALMQQRVIYVMTHDSIGLGEDGPTHQPVEHLAALRAIPNLFVFRPCDTYETAECWQIALANKTTPSILALSRQNLITLRTNYSTENKSQQGAYLIHETQQTPTIAIWATGSEVMLAKAVSALLEEKNIGVKIISVPCLELFHQQSQAYKNSLHSPLNIVIEAGIAMGWQGILKDNGLFFGVENFGISAPEAQAYKHFGLSKEQIVEKILAVVTKA